MAGITPLLFPLLALLSFVDLCHGSRKLSSLVQSSPAPLIYHKGALLQGDVPVSLLWYGNFTPAQKSIISDFLLSLTLPSQRSSVPTVSQWWGLVDTLVTKAGKKKTRISISGQVSDDKYSLGKLLKRTQILQLAAGAKPAKSGLALVLTATEVAVDGFCMSSCGTHGTLGLGGAPAYVWVGNSEAQCPGQCAWPFHRPIYGPQTPPLLPPNGDVGVDGMVINVAALLAEAVTNLAGGGYFQGEAGAEMEVASACSGVYGSEAYPGYAGKLLVDSSTGASYNAEGLEGRKYLVPALFDPATSRCSTLA